MSLLSLSNLTIIRSLFLVISILSIYYISPYNSNFLISEFSKPEYFDLSKLDAYKLLIYNFLYIETSRNYAVSIVFELLDCLFRMSIINIFVLSILSRDGKFTIKSTCYAILETVIYTFLSLILAVAFIFPLFCIYYSKTLYNEKVVSSLSLNILGIVINSFMGSDCLLSHLLSSINKLPLINEIIDPISVLIPKTLSFIPTALSNLPDTLPPVISSLYEFIPRIFIDFKTTLLSTDVGGSLYYDYIFFALAIALVICCKNTKHGINLKGLWIVPIVAILIMFTGSILPCFYFVISYIIQV